MPYTAKSLPPAVKGLPKHARRIWMSAFNAAAKQYDSETQMFATAWSAIAKAGYVKDEKTGRWHRKAMAAKESEAPRDRRAVIVEALIDHVFDHADPPDEPTSEALTEEMYPEPNPVERYMDECYREAIYSALNLLSRRELEITEDERDALTALVSRLVRKLGLPAEEMEESAPPETINLDALQETAERELVGLIREAGQRHRNEDYRDFDTVLALIKKLRGLSPQELQAAQAEAQTEEESPEQQVMAGYHAGEPEAVTVQESGPMHWHEAVTILAEASEDGSGRVWQVCVIEAGLSKNQRLYSIPVLKAALPLFEGARVHCYDRVLKGREVYDHLTDHELAVNPHGYSKDLVGYLSHPRIEGHRLMASLTLLPSADWLAANLQAAFADGQRTLYGLSIDAEGTGHMIESGGRSVLHVDAIQHVRSVDVVSFPAAGGGFVRLVASVALLEREERQAVALVETLQVQMRLLEAQIQLSELLDEHGIGGDAKRAIVRWVKEFIA